MYDVIVGNVASASGADDRDPEWHMDNVVITRSGTKRVGDANHLNIRTVKNWLDINREKIVEM